MSPEKAGQDTNGKMRGSAGVEHDVDSGTVIGVEVRKTRAHDRDRYEP
ncbi:hypothetical protein [Streptomyces mexicanus]